MLRHTLAISTVVLCWSSLALGQIDTERMKPAVTHDGWVNAEGSGIRHPDDPWELGAFLNYGYNPLVVVDANDDVSRQLVAGRLGVDLLASVSLAKPLAVGLGLPLYVAQTGDDDPSFAGLGDVRLVPKLTLLSDRSSGIGLAVVPELRAPTHTGDFSGGARNVTFVPKAVLDHRFINGIRVGFNAGVLLRESAEFANVTEGNEFIYAVALGYRFGGIEGSTEMGVELDGAVGLSESDNEEVPLELFGYVRHAFSHEWEIIGGPAVGLLAGYGVPTFRAFVGLRYAPTSHDADHDGIGDSDDLCPNDREDRDGYEDSDGCPEEDPDADQDGVPDAEDECPNAKETINGFQDEDGCPDPGDPRVIYEEGELKILDVIPFEHGSAQLKEESYPLLDQVALTLKANPEIKKMRVEGHTDDTGPEDVNQRLSQQRAETVRRYLVNKGVAPQRLEAKGYGESKPLIDEITEEARKKNRRVEFVVVDDE